MMFSYTFSKKARKIQTDTLILYKMANKSPVLIVLDQEPTVPEAYHVCQLYWSTDLLPVYFLW